MRKLAILKLIINFLGFFSLTMMVPVIIAFVFGEKEMLRPFLIPIGITIAITVPVFFSGGKIKFDFNETEGILLVASIWISASLLGAVPYYLSGYVPSYSNAVFESVSGFTTTGATVIPDVEILPYSLHFWRGMTHWLGGMGIVLLTVALVPFLGVGGFQLVKAEATGPVKAKFTPKITSTAKILWLIYCGLTAIQAVLLALGGMNWFDALIHAFSTVATGGFSTRNASIAYYQSAYIDWVCVIFMLIAGFNSTLIYRALQGRFREIFHNSEAKAYGLIILVSVLAVTCSLLPETKSLEKSLRYAFFDAVSIMTTTGFMIDDHNKWPAIAQSVIFLLMFTGGCSGSTAGGIKVIRLVILFKQTKNELKKILYPFGVFSIHLDKKPGRKDVVYSVAGFVYLYLLMVFAGFLLICSSGVDLYNSLNASLILLGNIGLGFGELTTGSIFYHSPAYVKWGLSLFMIIGRLELYTVFLLLFV
jgi:trk system potassium uptake protein TrkH